MLDLERLSPLFAATPHRRLRWNPGREPAGSDPADFGDSPALETEGGEILVEFMDDPAVEPTLMAMVEAYNAVAEVLEERDRG